MLPDVLSFNLGNVGKAISEDAPLLIALADIRVEGYQVHVHVPWETSMGLTGTGRKILEADDSGLRRYPAGGGTYILNLLDGTFALARYRDIGAPTWKEHFTPGSGLGSSLHEIYQPLSLVEREMAEEFLILTPDGILIPNPNFSKIMCWAAMGSLNLIDKLPQLPPAFGQKKIYLADPYRISPRQVSEQEVMVTIGEGDQASTTRFNALVDLEDPHGVDFLKIVGFDLPYRLEDLVFFDGETKKEGESLNGEVVCLWVENGRITKKIAAAFQDGKRIPIVEREFKATLPLKALMNAL